MMTKIAAGSDIATFINVFTVESAKQQALLERLKIHADTLVGKQPGFLTANAYRSLDGTRAVNYVQWTSVEASKAIHQNPDIGSAFASYQDLGVSMDLRYYEVAFARRQPIIVQAHSNHHTQIDVLHVAPKNQQLLLEKLTQVIEPTISQQTGNLSTVWLRSLDGTRIINYSQWSSKDAYDAAIFNLNQIAGDEEQASISPEGIPLFMQAVQDLIEQIESHLYKVDFIVDPHGSST